jgi:FKBP-type peptidyl-prolyl cis-trans isomerase FkpA
MKIFCLFLIATFFVIGNISCSKDNNSSNSCTPATPQSEQAQIVAYTSTNGIIATAHSSGLYYEVINPGSGVNPGASSKVYVKYTGKLTNGTVFDSQNDSSKTGWLLGNLISGWQIGLPLIKKGGIIRLIIPSSMGYGCLAAGTIPANSILYFEIELVDVQ